MSDDIWSKQFYKALEVVGKLTEVEKLRLANMLIAVSDIKNEPSPLWSGYNHTLNIEDLPKHSCGSELYEISSTPDRP